MTAKKNLTKKASKKDLLLKKDASKKIQVSKGGKAHIIAKKFVAKKVIIKKTGDRKPAIKAKITTVESVVEAVKEIPTSVDCMCMQKKPNGKYYSFTLQQGRWVQASAIPFPTKEACEEACC